jgi:hypothetical protein
LQQHKAKGFVSVARNAEAFLKVYEPKYAKLVILKIMKFFLRMPQTVTLLESGAIELKNRMEMHSVLVGQS